MQDSLYFSILIVGAFCFNCMETDQQQLNNDYLKEELNN